MTDVGKTRTAGKPRKGDAGSSKPGFFAAIALFVRQILDELRKVVRPTRSELWNYTLVVIVFVTFMMAMVAALDFGFSKLVDLVFGS